mmetsp:Transcript_8063/g.14784  ORF Transcript_8063/g.14784 Transcript_8063/m.14784 type:complete len:1289 (-) Transcript_8063:954-4820(-)
MAGGNKKKPQMVREEEGVVTAQDEAVPEQQRSKDSVLQVFWSLADVKKETRIEATRDFLNIKSVLDVESSDHAYSVKRLVRGLTSSRGAARQGFSVALTQLIRNCPEIDVDQVLEQLNQVTEVNGSMKADVKRGYWIGRLFGYLSLVRSGRCSNEKVLVGIIQGCLVLGKKKDWMREFSTEIICDILNLMNEGELTRTLDEVKNFGAFTEKTFKEISAWELSLLCTLDECTLNKRKAQEAFHRHITFRIPHVKAEEEGNSWEELVEPLRLASTTFPRLHSVWPKLVRIACADGTESFKSLWELIEQHFVVEGSHQRRYCAIKLFEYSTSYLVETGKFEWVRDVLLTETFLKFLVHNAVSEERYLFAVANRALSHLGNALAADNVSRFYRLAILGYIRTYAPKNFDKRSKSELSSKLLSIKDIADDAKSTSAQIKHLQKLFQEQLTSGNDNPWTVDALYCVCRNIKDGDVRLETSGKVAEFLFEKMFFLSKKSAEPAPESFQQMCCSVISKLITDMVLHESSAYNTMTKEDEKSQAKYWKQKLDWGKVEKLNEMYDKMQSSSVVSISEDEAKARSAALTAVKKLKKSKIDNELMLGISLIVQNLSLQSILLEVGTGESEMEVNIDIPELLSDLTMCCDRLSSKKNKKNDLDPMVVLTDVLIAVESQPSMLLRAVVKNSFRLISSQSTASSIEAILDVLMSRHTVDIKNKGKEEGGSDDEEEGESGEEEEEEEESNQEKVTPELVSLLPIRVEEQDMDEEGWEQVTKNARKRLSPKGADGDSKQVLACTDSFETIACSDSCARSRGDSGETISLSSVNSSNSIVEEAQQIISVPVSPDNLCSQQLTVSSIVVPQLRISPAYHNTTVHVVPNVGLQTEVLASSSRLVNHLCTVEGIRDSVSSALSYDLQEMATMLEEIAERRRPWQLAVAERIKEAVETLFPGASAQVFGSLATSLAAPCSDLDMVIQNLSCPPAIALRTLVIHLKQQSWVQMLQAVEHSAVPVIRLSTAQIPISFGNQGSLINVDITFDSMTHRGLLTCTLVKQLLHRYPPLKPLTLVLKQFLVEKGLNDPFVGGLSSYGLVLMITHILQKHFPSGIPLGDISHTQFLGPIFVSFLCEYANPKFPEQGVWVDPSSFQSQEDILRRRKEASIMLQHLKVSKAPLYILDPLDIRNNIGRTCFGINQVIQAFSEALEAIRITAVRPATLNQDWSILGSVFSTGHHRHVVNLVTKVWCPRENPARTTFELREWALTAKSVMETVSQMNHICPICKHKPHAASCTLKQLLLNFPS